MFHSVDPRTGERFASYEELTPAATRAAIEAAHAAFLSWRAMPFAERAEPMRALGALLEREAPALARLMAREMGKPVRDGAAEARKCAAACAYYAEHAARFLASEFVPIEARASWIDYEPLGVVLAIMPWNFPFWQVVRFAAPALMAGNAGLLKHAENVPGCAEAIADLVRRAGFPAGLFANLPIDRGRVRDVIAHPLVRAVTLTGSERAGRDVAAIAGAQLKKTVLELGGSDAYLVLADADLELAAAVCTRGRLVNSGQSCIAAKRFLVVPEVRAEFERRFTAAMAAVHAGDPLDEGTTLGPLARLDLRENLHRQVTESVAAGARCLLGGTVPPGPGAWYPPTVLTDVGPGMPAYSEELFGPVAAIIPVKDEEDAVRVANDSPYGLGAAVLSRHLARAERIAERLECGMVFVNDNVRSDQRLPFGGVKGSGYGRELSVAGMREFVNVKSIVV